MPCRNMSLNTWTPQCGGLILFSLCLDNIGVFDGWRWWWFSCCLCCTEELVLTVAWADIIQKHTTRYLGADWRGCRGGWGCMEVSELVRWESGSRRGSLRLNHHWLKTHGGHTCKRQRLRRLASTWKLHLWGERGGGGVKLHVNQALYKFSLCLLEELNRLTPRTRAPGKKQQQKKNKFCCRKRDDTLQIGWFCFREVWPILWLYGCIYLKGTAFYFLPNCHSRGRLSFCRSRKEEDWPTGRQERLHNDASCLGFLARWPHLGKTG